MYTKMESCTMQKCIVLLSGLWWNNLVLKKDQQHNIEFTILSVCMYVCTNIENEMK